MRKAWIWTAGAGGVLVLAIAAWFAGEWMAAQIITTPAHAKVVENLALPAGEDLSGPVG